MLKRVFFVCLVTMLSASAAFSAITWTPTSALPAGTKDGALIAYNGYVYLFGGRSAANDVAVSTAFYAPINTDGSLGAWQSTTALPEARALPGAYAYNGRVYVWGGWRADWTTMRTGFYASINPDGSLGSWTTSASLIPQSGGVDQMDSFGRGILGLGKYVYIIGGEMNDASLTNKCYYSEIQGSGDFGTWNETTSLPVPTNGTLKGYWFHGVGIVQGTTSSYIYVVGGNHGGTSESHILSNTINADGSLGTSWTESSTPLLHALYEHGCAVQGNVIYAVGGLNGSTPQTYVQAITVDPTTGTVQGVVDETALAEGRARTHAVCYSAGGKDILLNAGGAVYSGAPYYDTCFYSDITIPTATPTETDTPVPPTPTLSSGVNYDVNRYE